MEKRTNYTIQKLTKPIGSFGQILGTSYINFIVCAA